MIELLKRSLEQRIFRALDIQFAQIVAEEHEYGRLLVAACLSYSVGIGHICLPLSQLNYESFFRERICELTESIWKKAGRLQDWNAILNGWSALSSKEDAVVPIILHENRLYLHRFWKYESTVVNFFQSSVHVKTSAIDAIINTLNVLFDNTDNHLHKIAAALALTKKITIICGGPGTGKTSTVAKILAAIIRLHQNNIRIKLVAPTGKAASRLTESLRKQLEELRISSKDRLYFPSEAITLHRLLGATLGTKKLRYHHNHFLNLDVLIVDEASMVDLSMMANLISALPPHAKVVFLGDRDQLASVEAGSVFGDLCHYAETGYSKRHSLKLSKLTGCIVPYNEKKNIPIICDSVCLFRKSYRFNHHSGIGQLATAVKTGNTHKVQELFKNGATDIEFHSFKNIEDYYHMLKEVIENYRYFLHLVYSKAEPKKIITTFSKYKLLCALRDGPFGVQGLNYRIEQQLILLKLILLKDNHQKWYEGKPIMITQNDNILGVFNGDIGITLYDKKGSLKVFFCVSNDIIKSIHPNRLPNYDTAWVMTVHKAQGSEFEKTALVMPNQFFPLLTRELIYTAITRASKKLTLYCEYKIFIRALQSDTQRYSGLLNRLNQ